MVSTLFLWLAMTPHSVAHHGWIQRTTPTNNYIADFTEIYVKSCNAKHDGRLFLPIYSDPELTIPAANPIATSMDGRYVYYTYTPYVFMIITEIDGKSHIIENCPAGTSEHEFEK